jgi:transcriptional regulator with XRE-family HTH domain
MLTHSSRFGAHLRKLRVQQGVGLRKLAMAIGISPTYLSKVERAEMPPPAERQVVALAEALGQDSDVLLGMAGRVASDLPAIIKKHPRKYAALLRALRNMRATDFDILFSALGAFKVIDFKTWKGTPDETNRQLAQYKSALDRIDYGALALSKKATKGRRKGKR